MDADGLILTAPVPQSIDLLARFDHLSSLLHQAPSYYLSILLLLWPSSASSIKNLRKTSNIHDIVVQDHIKQNPEPVPIAVHATYKWSSTHYEQPDQTLKSIWLKEIGEDEHDYDRVQIKRWVNTYEDLTQRILIIGKRTSSADCSWNMYGGFSH